MYTVTGQHADEEEIEKMIESGESETIFQKAILEQVGAWGSGAGRGWDVGEVVRRWVVVLCGIQWHFT